MTPDPAESGPADSYPRRSARTRRFALGAPRSFTVTPDGGRVWFLRSPSSVDPVHSIWTFEVAGSSERQLVDPRSLGSLEADLPAAERSRRERARESGEGIVSYATDRAGRRAVMVVGGQVVVADADVEGDNAVAVLDAAPGAFDPRLDPSGDRVAYVADGALRIVSAAEADRRLVAEDGVTWGSAEFIAGEEFSRSRGFWWAPDGRSILAERVDESTVAEWHIAAPVEPWTAPRSIRYPAAGTDNAQCSLAIFGLDGSRVDVDWDAQAFPYLLTADWAADAPLTISVLSRDQRTMSVQTIDPTSGHCTEVARRTDSHWVEPVGGVPTWHAGRLVTVFDDCAEGNEARRLFVDGEALTPPDMQVRSVAEVAERGITFAASWGDPTSVEVYRLDWNGEVERLSVGLGMRGATVGGDTMVVTSAGMDHDGTVARVLAKDTTWESAPVIASHAEAPGLDLHVRFLELGERQLRAALVMPSAPGDEPLPVLLDPYGGPHAQRVVQARSAYAASQWLADQGFAVLIVDGRGTPGRGPVWERAVSGDLAGPVLDDQVDALAAAGELEPRLDLGRVGIRGWSFGGYLAALAVLARPDVFHAAVAGAPVTDWRLYDTGYAERYLGMPDTDAANYERTDLTPLAAELRRPLMLIHGLADDNVVAAHTLQLSRALLEAGRPHTVLPLSGVTHMTPQESVAENLLLLQVEFLKEHLGMADDERAQGSGAGAGGPM